MDRLDLHYVQALHEGSVMSMADGYARASYGVDGEAVDDPQRLAEVLDRLFRTVAVGQPYLVDVGIEARFGGADSSWYDFFAVAQLRGDVASPEPASP